MTENETRYEERYCVPKSSSFGEYDMMEEVEHDFLLEGLEEEILDGEEDTILHDEEASVLVGSDGTNDDSEGELEEEITIDEEESDAPLDDCYFSDEDDEILEARNNPRLRGLTMIRGLGTKDVENVSDQIVTCTEYSKNCDHSSLKFDVGMRLKDVTECKEVVIL